MSTGEDAVLLDCGIPIKRLKEALWGMGRRLSDISACLVTHEHGDHIKAAQALADNGVSVYMSAGTAKAAGLCGSRILAWKYVNWSRDDYTMEYIGDSFLVYPFHVDHDAAEPVGFCVMDRKSEEKLLYVTDTPYLRYSIPEITHVMIEANYDPDIIVGNIEGGAFPASHAKRVLSSHMSIDTALLTLERMDRSRLKEVWLIHLSSDNAGDDFKRRVQELCGCEVYVA